MTEEKKPTLPEGQWHLLMVPDTGNPTHYEFDRLHEFKEAAEDAVAARDSNRFQGSLYAFVGKRVDLRDVQSVLRMRIEGVGTLEAGPPQ